MLLRKSANQRSRFGTRPECASSAKVERPYPLYLLTYDPSHAGFEIRPAEIGELRPGLHPAGRLRVVRVRMGTQNDARTPETRADPRLARGGPVVAATAAELGS